MKETAIIFGGVVVVLAVMVFGSLGLSRLVRWLGWSQDVCAAGALLFFLLAGMFLTAWRFGEMEKKEKLRAESELLEK